ncbi:MAG: prephenate dehydrogenase/arogenate dehydrogenase family protein [Actinomycetota bacterium]
MIVAIIGSGLIGGSIGFSARSVPAVEEVLIFDRVPEVARRAVDRGAADRSAASIREAVEQADIVFVATPVSSIPIIAKEAIPYMKPGAILTDVGSTKARVVDEIHGFLEDNRIFIGGHPMAGTEEEGIEGARDHLFEGAWWILTPTKTTPPEIFKRLHGLITSFGCQILALEPDLHDELMAVISHLPHLTAATLMNMASEHGKDRGSLLSLAAGGFRDVTRVAASNPEMWIDICKENRDAIVSALEEFEKRLSDLRKLISDGDVQGLHADLDSARESRKSLATKPTTGELFEIDIPIPDRPGVLSGVTTIVGRLGVNIEDIQISHAEEGGKGLLRITVIGLEQATKALNALSLNNYNPRSLSL